ncbi:DUF2927 domain-containing protein [Neogemmobacter tilapiae]|uniref:ATP-dependent transcriptional regulator n=1 Tax=Neogemmobacter tilapiae TaxID=875041 RepID=A0A918TG37_9RHOB|nr:DUF2927 domain-containing protein [Gemmobacter tilapiae]GHC44592.1 hypothetical protein GCM10007315_02270 [Gemmobacter tilapiae]
MWQRLTLVNLFLSLSACAGWQADVARLDSALMILPDEGPRLPSFPPRTGAAPQQNNAQLAADFLDLEFALETGRTLPHLTRFEGDITYTLHGRVAASAAGDLALLLQRLRDEAGIALQQAEPGSAANITLNFLPKQVIRQGNPGVACFVVPGISTYAEYRHGRNRQDWATLQQRERLAIFLPGDASPQEIRDCLHEELAQALGPLNDLYRLSDSVFNDDNFHTVLTGYDMLMLRLHYAPELQNGMSREQVAAVLPGLLARLNPTGRRSGPVNVGATPAAWEAAMEMALGQDGSALSRQQAAMDALAIAKAEGWNDTRLAFSLFALGRSQLSLNAKSSIAHFGDSAALYRRQPGGAIHAAHVDMQLAAFALSQGWYDMADALAVRNIPVVQNAENAALLASFLLIRAECADQGQDHAAAQALREEGMLWARYGFGRGRELAARIAAIAALVRPLAPAPDRG